MYITIGKAAFKEDAEVFKKHFAKSIGIDLLEEKVKVVQISLAKLLKKVPKGSIRSCDKVRDHLLENTVPDVHQFLLEHNHMRFLDESKFTVSLTAEEELKTDLKGDKENNEREVNCNDGSGDEEMSSIQ